MADSKKTSFSTTLKSWAIVAKVSQIGPWVCRVDWCEGHWWCCSTYMAVKLSDISSKTGVGQPFENYFWELAILKSSVFWVGQFEFFFQIFFPSFPWKQVKVYWLARMGQKFYQAKNTFWPGPNILHPSVTSSDINRMSADLIWIFARLYAGQKWYLVPILWS